MGEQEAEYEAARRFVQFGQATARYGRMAPSNVPPPAVARAAAIAAARRYAPGLLRRRAPSFRDRRTERRAGLRRHVRLGTRLRVRTPDYGYRGGSGYGQPRRYGPRRGPGAWQPSDAWLTWLDEPPSGGPYDGGNGSGGDGGYDDAAGDDQGWFELG